MRLTFGNACQAGVQTCDSRNTGVWVGGGGVSSSHERDWAVTLLALVDKMNVLRRRMKRSRVWRVREEVDLPLKDWVAACCALRAI